MGSIYRQRGRCNWMIKYYRDGRPIVESARTDDKTEAKKLLRQRESAVDHGLPLTSRITRFRFEEAADDLLKEYEANGRRSLKDLRSRLKLHLKPAFDGRRMSAITTSDIRLFTTNRQEAGASNAEINRELAALKRMFILAIQGGKLLHRPYIPMLEEHNVRTGFFEREQFEAVRKHLPDDLKGVATFAYYTGWRVPSEVLTLQWRQIDFAAGVARLDPHSTKNDEGRIFPFAEIPELAVMLKTLKTDAEKQKRASGRIEPWLFHRDGKPFVAEDGTQRVEFRAAWKAACTAAGCPGRIPHDFRRTAVRNLVRAGVSERVAMQLTGHKTRSVFDRYDIVNEADLRTATLRLATAAR